MIAITRRLSPSIVHCELTHLDRAPIDFARARAEHAAYEDALSALGCEVRRLPARDDQADAVFVEDTAVVLPELAIVARPGAASRRDEIDVVADALHALRPVVRIAEPATLDGGDVLRIGRRLYVGVGGRTNDGGIDHLRRFVESLGYTVQPVPIRGCLHLRTAATVVSDDLVLVNPEWVSDTAFDGMGGLPVHPTEPFAANALSVRGRVIHPEQFVRTRRRLEAVGLTVVPVPMSELAKAEAGVTCCSIIIDDPLEEDT